MTADDETARQERLYRLTVRSLYLLALGLNALVIYDQAKGTPEAAIFRARLAKAWGRLTRPVREREHFRRNVNQVLYEASTVTEKAWSDGDRD